MEVTALAALITAIVTAVATRINNLSRDLRVKSLEKDIEILGCKIATCEEERKLLIALIGQQRKGKRIQRVKRKPNS